MTTFVSQRATAARASTRSARPLSALGTWVGDRARSYRAATQWHRDNVDTVTPLLFLHD